MDTKANLGQCLINEVIAELILARETWHLEKDDEPSIKLKATVMRKVMAVVVKTGIPGFIPKGA